MLRTIAVTSLIIIALNLLITEAKSLLVDKVGGSDYLTSGELDDSSNDSSEEDYSGRGPIRKQGFRSLRQDIARNELNIPIPVAVDQKSESYRFFFAVAQRLKETMNLSADPCADFYEYACGNSQRKTDVFFEMERLNDIKLMAEMAKPEHRNSKLGFVSKALHYYDTCIAAKAWRFKQNDGIEAANDLLNEFAAATGLRFSIGDTNSEAQSLDPTILGKALGVLSSFGVHTLMTPQVGSAQISGISKNLIFIDESTLSHPQRFYMEAGQQEMEHYKQEIMDIVKMYLAMNQIDFSESSIERNVLGMIKLEKRIAKYYNSTAASPVVWEKLNTSMFDGISRTSFVDFEAYFDGLSYGSSEIETYFAEGGQFALGVPFVLEALGSELRHAFKPDVLINYLFCRLLMSRKEYILENESENGEDFEEDTMNSSGWWEEPDGEDKTLLARQKCLKELKKDMPEIADRFDVDETKSLDRYLLVKHIQEVMDNVRYSLTDMLRRTFRGDRISSRILEAELQKVDIAIRYPEFTNDTELDYAYQDLTFEESDSYYTVKEKLQQFRFNATYAQLFEEAQHSHHRLVSADDVRYEPESSVISFASSLFAPPFFDDEWPVSLQYGGLGTVIGHELIHSFGEFQSCKLSGSRNFTTNILEKYLEMRRCVVDKYDDYCPLENTGIKPECLDGKSSASENLADTAGLIAAFLAYKSLVSMYGREPQLPDAVLQGLTHDQLFFLSFAQNYCSSRPSNQDWFRSIVYESTYSPNKYRVLGAVSDFSAFHNAFNCPLHSRRGCSERCYPWIPRAECEYDTFERILKFPFD